MYDFSACLHIQYEPVSLQGHLDQYQLFRPFIAEILRKVCVQELQPDSILFLHQLSQQLKKAVKCRCHSVQFCQGEHIALLGRNHHRQAGPFGRRFGRQLADKAHKRRRDIVIVDNIPRQHHVERVLLVQEGCVVGKVQRCHVNGVSGW